MLTKSEKQAILDAPDMMINCYTYKGDHLADEGFIDVSWQEGTKR